MRNHKIIHIPRFLDERGNLSYIENDAQIPFVIRRVHWIYDVPGGEQRGGVAYKETEEFVVALSGSFDVVVDDGVSKKVFNLNRSYMGVYVPKGCWRSIENFSTNSLAMIAASTYYDTNDAIRDYDMFLAWSQKHNEEKNIYLIEPAKTFNNSMGVGSVYGCTMIELDRHHSNRKGDISVVENGITVPFDVKRVYYLYDVPGGVSRGGHAHKELYQLIVAASGSFTVILDDGKVKRSFHLNRPYQGLLVTPGIWRTLEDFSSGSVCMVLASEKYDAADYIRSYDEFIQYKQSL